MTALRVVCAWCSDLIEKGDEGAATSHGICPDCFVEVTKKLEPARCGCGALATVKDAGTDYCGVCAARRLRDVARQASARRRAV